MSVTSFISLLLRSDIRIFLVLSVRRRGRIGQAGRDAGIFLCASKEPVYTKFSRKKQWIPWFVLSCPTGVHREIGKYIELDAASRQSQFKPDSTACCICTAALLWSMWCGLWCYSQIVMVNKAAEIQIFNFKGWASIFKMVIYKPRIDCFLKVGSFILSFPLVNLIGLYFSSRRAAVQLPLIITSAPSSGNSPCCSDFFHTKLQLSARRGLAHVIR